MSNVERVIEEFDVTSADGQRVRVRKSLVAYVRSNTTRARSTQREIDRAVYAGLARGGLERPVEPLGDDRFRIAGKEFTRLRVSEADVEHETEAHF